jgi:hypothetical protein
MNFCGCEDEHHMGGGLFQRFQQRVERRVGEHVHFVDNIDPILPPKRRKLDVLANLANVVHAGVRRPVDFDHVHRRALRNLLAIRTRITRRSRRPLLAIQRFGQNPGNRCFPHAAGTGKEKRMGNPLRRDRVHQRLHDVGLPDDVVKRPRPVFSCRNLVVHVASIVSGRWCSSMLAAPDAPREMSSKKWGQVILRHTERTAYRCFLPDLAGFTGFCCTGPGPVTLRSSPLAKSHSIARGRASSVRWRRGWAFEVALTRSH